MRAYIDGCYQFSAGNLRRSLETARYNGHGYAWNGLRAGIATLHPQRAIIDLEA